MPRSSIVLALLLGLTACGSGDSPPPPPSTVLLLTLDTTRWDAFGTLSQREFTPNIDAYAGESVTYRYGRTVTPLTLPSHASMLTGLYPPRHRVRINGHRPLSEEAETVAERASEAGRRTGAFVSAVVLDKAFGLAQGFEHFDQPLKDTGDGASFFVERPARETLGRALHWLQNQGDEPVFLWIHLFDPHEPHQPKEPYLGRAGRSSDERVRQFAPYYAEVGDMDAALGEFFGALRTLGRYEDTFAAVVADHGESLWDHGEQSHGSYLTDSTMRVPFFLRYPGGYRAGELSDEVVSVVDLAPTLAEVMALPAFREVDGLSLYRRTVDDDRGVYFETCMGFAMYGWSPLWGWADKDGKFVQGARTRFTTPREDAYENGDTQRAGDANFERYRNQIAALGKLPRLDEAANTEGELLTALGELGYVGISETTNAGLEYPSLLEDTGRRDPHDGAEQYAMWSQALAVQDAGRFAEAVRLHRALLAKYPDSYNTLAHLGMCLSELERWDEALEAYTRYLEYHPDNIYAQIGCAHLLSRMGRKDDALAVYADILARDPGNRRAAGPAVQLLEEAGRTEEAEEVKRNAMAFIRPQR